jgi:purine-nucleoside phosphorylase
MSEFISREEVAAAAAAVRQRCQLRPQIGLILGSGLSQLADMAAEATIIPYQDIPHWPVSTVPGHSGRLVVGRLGGKNVLIQQGRAHFYEGYSMGQITFPIRVMCNLGVDTIIITNAAGGIHRDLKAGDMMLIRDHINIPGIAGHNPLRGPNDEELGPRFPDMTLPYDVGLRRLALEVAASQGMALAEGVYAYVAGPSFETPAELRMLQIAGADAVGMSTVPSVVVARHSGLRVLGISTITNQAILDPTSDRSVTHEEVLETGRRVIPQLSALISGILQRL